MTNNIAALFICFLVPSVQAFSLSFVQNSSSCLHSRKPVLYCHLFELHNFL